MWDTLHHSNVYQRKAQCNIQWIVFSSGDLILSLSLSLSPLFSMFLNILNVCIVPSPSVNMTLLLI